MLLVPAAVEEHLYGSEIVNQPINQSINTLSTPPKQSFQMRPYRWT